MRRSLRYDSSAVVKASSLTKLKRLGRNFFGDLAEGCLDRQTRLHADEGHIERIGNA